MLEDVRVTGNQHGTFVRLEGETRELMLAYCAVLDCTPEEFLRRAIASIPVEGWRA